jgi:hypothetical protein
MTCSALGNMFEVFPILRCTSASLQTASRYRSIAFDSEGLPLRASTLFRWNEPMTVYCHSFFTKPVFSSSSR